MPPGTRRVPRRARATPSTADGSDVAEAEEHYRQMSARGLAYGPAFRTVGETRRSGGRAQARLETSAAGLSAMLLDGALQVALGLAPARNPDVLNALGVAQLKQGQAEPARHSFSESLALRPGQPEIRKLLASLPAATASAEARPR